MSDKPMGTLLGLPVIVCDDLPQSVKGDIVLGDWREYLTSVGYAAYRMGDDETVFVKNDPPGKEENANT